MVDIKCPSITGIVLCLNEEHRLAKALNSLLWCDDILVVDSGSSDKSLEIARSFNARVLINKQKGQFLITEQRNVALRYGNIQSEWILFLDADEEIGNECRAEIIRAISHHKSINAYEMTPRYWFFGKWLKRSQGYPNWHPRLLKSSGVSFVGGVWESFSDLNNVGRIRTPYEHFAFSKGTDDWIDRHQRYSTWDAKHICDFLESKDEQMLGTNRKLALRKVDAQLWYLKPITKFLFRYLYKLGILEGWQGLLHCLLHFTYDMMVVVKIAEIRRKQMNKPL